jgi:hypothetical protein
MMEIGMRFERAGRAALAGRWDLATYDVDELAEVFDADLRTTWGHEPPLSALARELTSGPLRALQEAARRRDDQTFRNAFAAAAGTCNRCHHAAAMGFIQIPETLGARVPIVTADP